MAGWGMKCNQKNLKLNFPVLELPYNIGICTNIAHKNPIQWGVKIVISSIWSNICWNNYGPVKVAGVTHKGLDLIVWSFF